MLKTTLPSQTAPPLTNEGMIERVASGAPLSEAEKFYLIRALQPPWKNRDDQRQEMARLISDLGLKIGGTIKGQAEKIAAGLRRPNGEHKAVFERILDLHDDKTLAASSIRRILSDWA
jgi:hypothetical protein